MIMQSSMNNNDINVNIPSQSLNHLASTCSVESQQEFLYNVSISHVLYVNTVHIENCLISSLSCYSGV